MARRISDNLNTNWIGQRFGKLVVIGFGYNAKLYRNTWKCVCDCGKHVEIYPANARAGRVRSCGCAQLGSVTTHGQRNTRLYRSWVDMRRRCRDEKHPSFANYGARGIIVCDAWHDFDSFWAWAAETGYASDLTLDRIDVNGNYEPSNCRWATDSQQARNRRSNRFVTVFGETISLAEAIERFGNGKRYDTVSRRIDKYGFSPERALTQTLRTTG